MTFLPELYTSLAGCTPAILTACWLRTGCTHCWPATLQTSG